MPDGDRPCSDASYLFQVATRVGSNWNRAFEKGWFGSPAPSEECHVKNGEIFAISQSNEWTGLPRLLPFASTHTTHPGGPMTVLDPETELRAEHAILTFLESKHGPVPVKEVFEHLDSQFPKYKLGYAIETLVFGGKVSADNQWFTVHLPSPR